MPEKMTTQIPRPVREQYEKGKSAYERQNYDYAITFFTAVLAQEPGFYECREALRVAQSKKNTGGTGFFKKMISGAGSSPLLAKGQIELMKNLREARKNHARRPLSLKNGGSISLLHIINYIKFTILTINQYHLRY